MVAHGHRDEIISYIVRRPDLLRSTKSRVEEIENNKCAPWRFLEVPENEFFSVFFCRSSELMVANVVLKPTPTRSAEYQQIGGGAGGSLGEQSAELSQYRTRAASSR